MIKYNIFTAVCVFLICTAGFCRAGRFAVSVEKDLVVVGDEIDVSLILLESRTEKSIDYPEEITCELVTGEQKIAVLAKKDLRLEASGKKENSSGVNGRYSLKLPSALQGQVIVSFVDIDAPRVVLDVVLPQAETHAAVTDNAHVTTVDKVYPTLDSMFSLYRPYLKNAAAYEPVYFLVGTDPEKSKFQISFKYRFFDPDAPFTERHPWIEGLYFGYTQTSFWDLQSESAPFDDTSYKPELFWLSRNFLKSEHGFLKGVFFQGGFQHESNGKAADFSRSTNFVYVKPVIIFFDDNSKLGFELSPKIWSYVGNDSDTNGDLSAYRGYFDLEAKFGLAESFVTSTHFRWADEGASFQLDISYPLHKIFGDALDVYFYAQYTNMLAESLLDYQERTQAFRLGLAFMR